MGRTSILIRNLEINGRTGLDVFCDGGVARNIGRDLPANPGTRVLDASGGALLRGLHDRHIHLFSLAASRGSVPCGPPETVSLNDLVRQLGSVEGRGWIRGIGYHESVAGELNKRRIDEFCDSRPVRIQHRSGKLWVLNSAACEMVGLPHDHDGQLFRQDKWLRSKLATNELIFDEMRGLSRELASFGLTHVTDATPSNDNQTHELLQELMPELSVSVMGNKTLASGERKLILDDFKFPEFDQFCRDIDDAHDQGRNIAVHCVTQPEVVFALEAVRTVGCRPGDRLEHASVTDDGCLELMKELSLTVVTQPSLVRERGDRYLADVDVHEQPWLYRARSFLDSDVGLAGGSDAPFGNPDPWISIEAAVDRTTTAGSVLNASERIGTEEALHLFAPGSITDLQNTRVVNEGDAADFCVLNRPWDEAQHNLKSENVLMTVKGGQITYDSAVTR